MNKQPKWMTWTGWFLLALATLGLGFSVFSKFQGGPELTAELVEKLGYQAHHAVPIGALELACLVLLLIPQTSILGAVLTTGYLGGAAATHVRINDYGEVFPSVFIGILIWLSLFLRDARIRQLLPIRWPNTEQTNE